MSENKPRGERPLTARIAETAAEFQEPFARGRQVTLKLTGNRLHIKWEKIR